MAEHAHADSHGHHITPFSVYMKTFWWLIFLMALTIFTARIPYMFEGLHSLPAGQQAGLSWLNNIVAMTIACIKATLVVLFFMGVKYSTNLTKLFAIMGFVWVTLMFIMFADYATRAWEPVQSWGPMSQDPANRGMATPR